MQPFFVLTFIYKGNNCLWDVMCQKLEKKRIEVFG